jgi:NAD+ kinase
MDERLKTGAIAFIASSVDEARDALKRLVNRYGSVAPEEADVIVALGGDGLMLQTLHAFMNTGKPIYGMNCGSVGFLMNEFREDDLPERIARAIANVVHPLRMDAVSASGLEHHAFAINEVSLFRQSYQAVKLKITIDDKVRLEDLTADGILVATPAGSTAYNMAARGPILPIYAPLLALTPLCAFRPRTWRGALLPNRVKVRIDALETDKRPVNAVADNVEFRSIVSVSIAQDATAESLILFDADHSWDDRILTEQFKY